MPQKRKRAPLKLKIEPPGPFSRKPLSWMRLRVTTLSAEPASR